MTLFSTIFVMRLTYVVTSIFVSSHLRIGVTCIHASKIYDETEKLSRINNEDVMSIHESLPYFYHENEETSYNIGK